MTVIWDYKHVPEPAKGLSVALGNFDGVHAGHRAVIDLARQFAKQHDTQLAVMMFEPTPRRFFAPDSPPFRIMRNAFRRDVLKSIGVDVLYELPFDNDMSQMSPRAFVENVLVNGIGLVHLAVGFDFCFGKGRAGTLDILKELAEEFGFALSIMPEVKDKGEKLSSTYIRDALLDGRPEDAKKAMGEYWIADGEVEHGQKRGRTLGFPTANISLGRLIHPKFGIYAVWTRIKGETHWLPGVANFGRTPTTGDREPLLEVFLFDFDQDIYGKRIEIAFVSFLRSEQKFESLDALVDQMTADADAAKRVLDRVPRPGERGD